METEEDDVADAERRQHALHLWQRLARHPLKLCLRGRYRLHDGPGEQCAFVVATQRTASRVDRGDFVSTRAESVGDAESRRERHITLGGRAAHENRDLQEERLW
jgi:hypothetical protein